MKINWIGRAVEAVKCTCGGYCERVDCTQEEINKCGCRKDTVGVECCARVFACVLCKKRHLFRAESPEME